MKNTLAPRCLCWTAIQVVVFVVCYSGKVSTEIAQGCVGSELSIGCPEMEVIGVTAVVLGDSNCAGTWCCIKENDCTHGANENHRNQVHNGCNGKRRCTVKVLKEKIPCWYWNSWSDNDFERVTYTCADDPRNDTTNSTEVIYIDSNTEDNTTNSTDVTSADNNNDTNSNQVVMLAVMVAICLIVLIAIVVLVVMIRRKRQTQVKYAVEMTDIGNNDRTEVIYANENQDTSLNQGNGAPSPIYHNNSTPKAKKSQKEAKASKASETPNNAVYSLADNADSPSTRNVDSREPRYQVPRATSEVYSVVRNLEDPGQSGSTADADVYCDVETREPAKAANSAAGNVYDEACNWKESKYKALTTDKTNPAQKKASPAHTKAPDSYTKVNKPSKNTGVLDLKAGFPGNIEAEAEANTSDGFPSPTYETMSPTIPEGIYANEPALSPTRSLAASIASRGSEGENPYCDMQSPPVRFKEDGCHTVIENDLYSH